jgi:hypothetical protein
MYDNAAFDDDLDFPIHDHNPERDRYDGLGNARALWWRLG